MEVKGMSGAETIHNTKAGRVFDWFNVIFLGQPRTDNRLAFSVYYRGVICDGGRAGGKELLYLSRDVLA